MLYATANFGPIEVGRITVLDQPNPYFVTVNAVAIPSIKTPQQPESNFIKAFSDFNAAKAFVTSFFPAKTQPFIIWTLYP